MTDPRAEWGLEEEKIPESPAPQTGEDPDIRLARQRWAIEETREVHSARIWAIRVIALIATTCVTVYFWHVIGPHCARWLDAEDLAELRSVALSILSGVSASLAVGYFFRR